MKAFVSEGDKSESGRGGGLVRMLMPGDVLHD